MKLNIRLLYLYLFSFVGLIWILVSATRLLDLGLKVYVFQGADAYPTYSRPVIDPQSNETMESEKIFQDQQIEETSRQRKRTASESLAGILIGAPLYFYHWRLIRKKE